MAVRSLCAEISGFNGAAGVNLRKLQWCKTSSRRLEGFNGAAGVNLRKRALRGLEPQSGP